jgi:MOSC domain-containing protein YiiM
MASSEGRVLSVNVGRPSTFELNGRQVRSAIWKSPVVGRVAARGVNLEGDDQADRKAHGGVDKAIYAYAIEDLRWWESELGRSLPVAQFGENLTTEGIDVNGALVGERWEVGTTLLEVSEPRVPCWRLGVRMDDMGFVRRFTEALRPGAYLRIVSEGSVAAGDEIRVVGRPNQGLSVRDVLRIYSRDRQEAGRLLAVPGMSESWKAWAQALLRRAGSGTTPAPDPGCC